jgi:hypothetical protein
MHKMHVQQPLLTSCQQAQRLMQHVMCPAPTEALAGKLPSLLLLVPLLLVPLLLVPSLLVAAG